MNITIPFGLPDARGDVLTRAAIEDMYKHYFEEGRIVLEGKTYAVRYISLMPERGNTERGTMTLEVEEIPAV